MSKHSFNMKHTYFFLFLICFVLHSASAQKIYWANEVVNVSSQVQRTDKYSSAIHALGVPNAISPKDMSLWAWSPKTPNGGKEHIKVRFKSGVRGVRQVYISESESPGAITKITLFDNRGKKHVVFENKHPKPISRFNEARFFRVSFPPTSYYVQECLVEINTKYVRGAHIDAIGISDYYGEIKLSQQINDLQYSSKIPKPENLGRQINSNYSERLPIISPDGNTLYFARKNHPDNLGTEPRDDIWVSKRKANNQWSYATNIGTPLNTSNHNFVIAVNPTGTNLYLGNRYRSNSEGFSMSSPKRGVWAKPIDMKIDDHYNDNKFVAYHVSIDESVLLMSVERKDGFGERDLYVSFHKGEGNWTKPKNLGRTINTVGIESSVFLAADGKTLYFSSNGHYNYGGLDIFMSKRLDDSWTNWSEPKNLGPNINTYGNDFNYTIPASGEYAYFSSDDNSYGESDLFRILLPEEARPEPVMLMTGRIVDVTTNQPIQAKVKYNPLDKKKQSSNTPVKKQESEANDDGSYQVVLPYGENVEVYADIEGYFPISESMELADENLEELDSDNPNDPMMNFKYQETPPSKEEIALEKEMARLERELADLKNKKTEPKKYEAPYTRSQVVQSSSSRPSHLKPKSSPVRDSELDYLKQKYYNQLKENRTSSSTPKGKPADKNNKEVNDMYAKLYGKKKEDKKKPNAKTNTSSHSDVTGKPRPKRKNDKEANSLYEKLYGKKKTEDQPKREPFVPKEKESNSYVDEKESVVVTKPEPKADLATTAEDIPEDEPTFEEVEQQVRRELRDELVAQIKAELRKELMDEVKKELEKESRNREETAILDDVAKEVERENLVELESIPMLNSSVDHQNTEVELELKALIVAEMKEELKEELTAPIKEELKDEMAVRTKEKEKDETQKKMEEWKKRRQNTSSTPSPKTAPKKDPEYVELNQDIQVVPIKVGQVIPMNNIFFDANKSSIKEQSAAELERVLEFLTTNGNLVVEVGGHTNGWCSSSFADELSRGRAKEVRNFFIENGVPENRIQYRGYGKQMPIDTNETLAGRKKNQRVELKILEILD